MSDVIVVAVAWGGRVCMYIQKTEDREGERGRERRRHARSVVGMGWDDGMEMQGAICVCGLRGVPREIQIRCSDERKEKRERE